MSNQEFAFVADRNVFVDAHLFLALKTATKPNLENQPPYAAVSVLKKPQHVVVLLSIEIVFTSAGYEKSPVLEPGRELINVVLVCLHEHEPADPYNMASFNLFAHKKRPLSWKFTSLYHERGLKVEM